MLSNNSTYLWSLNYVRLPKGKWDDRPWQIAIMDDTAREVVILKPSQVGITTITLCKVLHFAEQHLVRVMYTLPRRDDVTDLVGSKLDPMIVISPHLQANIGAVNSVRTKEYANSFIHFSEASVPPRMLDVDMLAHDEVDLSDQNYLDQYKGRLTDSKFKYRYQFSTPSITGYGIDNLYKASNQKQWYVKCNHCSRWQVLSWASTMKVTMGNPYFGCQYCNKVLVTENIREGRWVAEYPDREVSGYKVTPFMGKWSPEELYSEYENSENLKNFFNLILGEAYSASVHSMTLDMFRDNCFTEPYKQEFGEDSSAPMNSYFMGVDQGNDLYVVVGKVEDNLLKVVYSEKIPFDGEKGFDRLPELMEKYNIRYAVVDALPNRHSARDFANKYRRRVGLALYSQVSSAFVIDEDRGLVNIERTEALDGLRDDVSSGKIKLWGEKPDGPVLDIITHCLNVQRDEVVRKLQSGERVVGVWRKTGPDHFAHCLSYLRVASMTRRSQRKSRFDVIT